MSLGPYRAIHLLNTELFYSPFDLIETMWLLEDTVKGKSEWEKEKAAMLVSFHFRLAKSRNLFWTAALPFVFAINQSYFRKKMGGNCFFLCHFCSFQYTKTTTTTKLKPTTQPSEKTSKNVTKQSLEIMLRSALESWKNPVLMFYLQCLLKRIFAIPACSMETCNRVEGWDLDNLELELRQYSGSDFAIGA